MEINVSKEQFRDLVIMSGIANSVLGALGDALPDADYKKRSVRMEELEEIENQSEIERRLQEIICQLFEKSPEGRN